LLFVDLKNKPLVNYLNLEKDILDIKNRFDNFDRLIELNKSLPRNRKKKDEYNKKNNKDNITTFNGRNKPVRDNKLIRRLTIKEIEKITSMSKSTYYRLKEKSKNKGTTFWKN
jgi:DNA-directed RNA polymerase specialized sigma subunit